MKYANMLQERKLGMKKKKLVKLMLVLTCILGLTACSSSNEDNKDGGTKFQAASQDEEKTDESPEASQDEEKTEEKPDESPEEGKNNGEDKDTQNPMKIESEMDFMKFRMRVANGEDTLDAYLEVDLDLSEICGPGIGDWEGIYRYNGVFDGQGHTICNLYAMDEEAEFTGLFWGITGGTIKNLGLENVQLKGKGTVGGIAAIPSGTIEDCWVSGTITGICAEESYLGGIAGRTSGATIKSCVNKAELVYVCEEAYEFCGYVGGIAGYTQSATVIENCINEGDITGNGGWSGGIAGVTDSGNPEINRSINKGNVYGKSIAGGVIGYAEDARINRCGNEGRVEAMVYAGGLAGKTSESHSQFNYIKNSYNHGEVVVSEWPDDWACYDIYDCQVAAGLVGVLGKAELVNSYSLGKVVSQCEEDRHASMGLIGMQSDSDGKIYNCYFAGELAAVQDRWEYGIGEIRSYDMDNVYSIDGYQIYAVNVNQTWMDSYVCPAVAFTDGTVLGLLQGYADSGTAKYDELKTLCGWVQGEQGPVLDWEVQK